MGLDSVELVMAVEARFGVQFSDPECTRIGTVADLAALVISKLPKSPSACATARTFYDLRTQLVTQCGAERRSVRPGAQLQKLFPETLRHAWKRLQLANDRIPRLVTNPGTDALLCCAAAFLVIAAIAGGLILINLMGTALGTLLCFGILPLVVTAFVLIQNRLSRHPPYEIATVGDLARWLAPIAIPRTGSAQWLLAQQEVLDEVRKITASQLGMPIEQVKASSHFIRDLNLN